MRAGEAVGEGHVFRVEGIACEKVLRQRGAWGIWRRPAGRQDAQFGVMTLAQGGSLGKDSHRGEGQKWTQLRSRQK